MTSQVLFWYATVVFAFTYVAIATEKIHKTTAAMIGAALMLLVILHGPTHGERGAASRDANGFHKQVTERTIIENDIIARSAKYEKLDVYSRYVNFNVIFTLVGMMILVNILSGTGLFQYVAVKSAKFAKGSPIRTMVLLVIASAFLSAFLDNVTTVLLIMPVTLLVTAELSVPAMPFLMAETFAANMGGTATLIGDPPNLIIGSFAHLPFMAFLVNLAPFVIVILFVYCLALKLYYGKRMSVTVEQRAKIMEMNEKAAITDMDNMKRGGLVMGLTIFGFLIHGALHIQPSVIAMSGAALGLLVCKIDVDHALEKVEWSTIFFFLGLFVVVNGADCVGLMDTFGGILRLTSHWHPLVTVLVVMWVSGVVAAVMNCVSYTAAMVTILGAFLNATPVFRDSVELQRLMWWGLALSVCLGANGTMVGAAANMVTVGIAGKAGHTVTFKSFLAYGVPVTLGCLVMSSFYVIGRYFLFCQ